MWVAGDNHAHQRNADTKRTMSKLISKTMLCIAIFLQCQACVSQELNASSLENPYPDAGKVNLIRDVWGVPHVYAKTERDGYFGAGYALAEDNLDNILFRYLVLNARSSETFGEGFADTDWFVQAYNILDDAKRAYEGLDTPIQESYSAYIAGLKAYMREHPDKVPNWWNDQIELEAYLPAAFLHWLSVIFSVSYGASECAIDGPEIKLNDLKFVDNTVIDARHAIAHASNQMGIMNQRTQGDVAYLISDPHVTFTAKRSEIRIHAGELNASGIVVAGYVAPMLGHTNTVAWAHTTGFPDVADCYVFDIDPDKPEHYFYAGESKAFLKKNIEIKLRYQPAQIREQRYVEKNGLTLPVHAIRDGKAYVPASGDLLRPGGHDRTSYLFGRAKTVDDILVALDNGHFAQNIMAADTQGNLIYVRMGTTPVRPQGEFDWTAPLPGGTAASDWLGIHPVSDLVQVRNPKAGYLQNNNVSADKMLAADDLSLSLRPEGYPQYIYNGAGSVNARGIRAIEVMSLMDGVAFNDVLKLATDEKWISAHLWSKALSDAIAHSASWDGVPQSTKLFASRIVDFDGVASTESIGAINLFAWLYKIGDDRRSAERLAERVLKGDVLSSADYDFMLKSLVAAEKVLTSKFGEEETRYGDVFTIGRGAMKWPLGGGAISIPDVWSEPTIRAYGFSPQLNDSGKQDAHRGGIHPQIMTVAIGGTVDSDTALAFGQSNNAASVHYSDQSRLLSEKRLKPSFFQYSNLRSNIESWKTLDVDY